MIKKRFANIISEFKKYTVKRGMLMVIGIILIGLAVGLLKVANLGLDPYTCVSTGISKSLPLSFGTLQLILNIIILIFVFFYYNSLIGLGTVVNMVCVGYIADFVCYISSSVLADLFTFNIIGRAACALIGIILLCLGAALYIEADMGISPYDSVAFMIEKATNKKITFRASRIISDITCVIIGVIFFAVENISLTNVIGVGTIITAFFTGPLIQFFRVHITKKTSA